MRAAIKKEKNSSKLHLNTLEISLSCKLSELCIKITLLFSFPFLLLTSVKQLSLNAFFSGGALTCTSDFTHTTDFFKMEYLNVPSVRRLIFIRKENTIRSFYFIRTRNLFT